MLKDSPNETHHVLRNRQDALGRVRSNEIILGFDDGPAPLTQSFASLLNAHDSPSTFFLTGVHVQQHPKDLLLLLASGHELGVHTMTHPNMTSLTPSQQHAEIDLTIQAIKQAVGDDFKMRYWRPPFGESTDVLRQTILDTFGLAEAQWSRDVFDWVDTTSLEDIENVIINATGNVMLLHDGITRSGLTYTALTKTIPQLVDRNVSFHSIAYADLRLKHGDQVAAMVKETLYDNRFTPMKPIDFRQMTDSLMKTRGVVAVGLAPRLPVLDNRALLKKTSTIVHDTSDSLRWSNSNGDWMLPVTVSSVSESGSLVFSLHGIDVMSHFRRDARAGGSVDAAEDLSGSARIVTDLPLEGAVSVVVPVSVAHDGISRRSSVPFASLTVVLNLDNDLIREQTHGIAETAFLQENAAIAKRISISTVERPCNLTREQESKWWRRSYKLCSMTQASVRSGMVLYYRIELDVDVPLWRLTQPALVATGGALLTVLLAYWILSCCTTKHAALTHQANAESPTNSDHLELL
ncbi:MAG: hypothetical protein MHM6MM_000603 [Cercozoa sp. M6MM]